MELNIRTHFETFLDKKITAIMDLTLSEIDVNPFLMSTIHHQLNLKTSQDLSKWMIMQRLERSMVTGFGSTLQNIAYVLTVKFYNLLIQHQMNHGVSKLGIILWILEGNSKNIFRFLFPCKHLYDYLHMVEMSLLDLQIDQEFF